jgi:hypothetical protein
MQTTDIDLGATRYIPTVAEGTNLVSRSRGPIYFDKASATKLDCLKTRCLPAFMYAWVYYSLVRIRINVFW